MGIDIATKSQYQEKEKNYEYDYKSFFLQDPQELVKKGTINWCTSYNVPTLVKKIFRIEFLKGTNVLKVHRQMFYFFFNKLEGCSYNITVCFMLQVTATLVILVVFRNGHFSVDTVEYCVITFICILLCPKLSTITSSYTTCIL